MSFKSMKFDISLGSILFLYLTTISAWKWTVSHEADIKTATTILIFLGVVARIFQYCYRKFHYYIKINDKDK